MEHDLNIPYSLRANAALYFVHIVINRKVKQNGQTQHKKSIQSDFVTK